MAWHQEKHYGEAPGERTAPIVSETEEPLAIQAKLLGLGDNPWRTERAAELCTISVLGPERQISHLPGSELYSYLDKIRAQVTFLRTRKLRPSCDPCDYPLITLLGWRYPLWWVLP